jgi:hypothetical protein
MIEAQRQFSARFAAAEAVHADRDRQQAESAAKLAATIEQQRTEARRLNEKIIELTGTKQDRSHVDRLEEENRWLEAENKLLRGRAQRAERKLKGLDELDELLGLGIGGNPAKASAEDVYRRLARKYHPDHNPQHAEVMKDLNELWQATRGGK